MNEQSFEFNRKGMPCFIRLSRGGRNTDHDIAEQVGLNMEEPALAQRERKDVRGPVPVAPCAIERAHGPIADEQDAQLGIRKTETPQQLP